jgi:hypothetical protein
MGDKNVIMHTIYVKRALKNMRIASFDVESTNNDPNTSKSKWAALLAAKNIGEGLPFPLHFRALCNSRTFSQGQGPREIRTYVWIKSHEQAFMTKAQRLRTWGKKKAASSWEKGERSEAEQGVRCHFAMRCPTKWPYSLQASQGPKCIPFPPWMAGLLCVVV